MYNYLGYYVYPRTSILFVIFTSFDEPDTTAIYRNFFVIARFYFYEHYLFIHNIL